MANEINSRTMDAARELVKTARRKKLVEARCLDAFNPYAQQLISNDEMLKLANDVVSSVVDFIQAGENFQLLIAE